jgi:phage/plasmid primase-like uncharacterized protein
MNTSYIDYTELNQAIDPRQLLDLIAYEKCNPTGQGKELRDYCPIHKGDNQRSLSIDTETKKFYCHNYSCKASGDMIELYAQSKSITNQQAAKELASHFQYKESVMQQNSTEKSNITFKAAQETIIENNIALEQIWNEAQKDGSHPYFSAKNVKPCHGLRYGYDEKSNHSILVPFKDVNNNLTALEYINTAKIFATGSKYSESFFIIDNRDLTTAKRAYLAEGLATALTIHEAIQYDQHSIVISCGPVDNVPKVARALRIKYPTLEIIACLDNDNAGKKATETISKENLNISTVMPDFTGIQKSNDQNDFNDLMVLAGIDIIKKQLSLLVFPAHNKKKSSISPSTASSSSQCKHIQEIIEEVNPIFRITERMIEYKTTGKVNLPGIQTNYSQLDNLIGGLQPEHLIVLAARTGMGKSWIALNMIKNIAIDQQKPVALFSLEMSYNQLINRLISLVSEVTVKTINNGTMDNTDFSNITKAIDTIKNSNLIITDSPENSSLEKLIENITVACEKNKAEFVVIDHIGLLKITKKSENRVVEMASIIREIKLTAKKFKIPIMALAQLNRDTEKNDRPKSSNIRESGAIEQDADIILLAHQNNAEKQNTIDIILDKNRDGEQNTTLEFSYDDCWNIKEKKHEADSQQDTKKGTHRGSKKKRNNPFEEMANL